MSPRSARSGSPVSTVSSTGGSNGKDFNGVGNLARADGDLIPKSFDLNEDMYSDPEETVDKNADLNLLNPHMHDRSISYGEGIPPEAYLLQNHLRRMNLEESIQRTFSAPISSRLGHLQNPNISNFTHTSDDASDLHPSSLQKQSSQELADLVQLPIQTIIQLSPPHLLDHAKEQYAACGLTFPTPSISSFLTVSKALNYLSVFLASPQQSKRIGAPVFNLSWDIGEMLQGVADSIAGLAAERSINIIIAHSGANLQHISVKGSSSAINEGSLAFGLLHIIRKILYTALPGSSLEICLFLTPDLLEDEPTDPNEPNENKITRLNCTFEIHHHNPSPAVSNTKHNSVPSPFLANLVTSHILSELVADLCSRPVYANASNEPHRRSYNFVLTLFKGDQLPENHHENAENEASRQPFGQNFPLAREPTLRELEHCASRTLQNYDAELYCHSESVFAKHVSGYLSSWGMTTEVHNISSNEYHEDLSPQSALSKASPMAIPGARASLVEDSSREASKNSSSFESAVGSVASSSASGTGFDRASKDSNRPRFVIIDDETTLFKKKLRQERLKVIRRYHKSMASHTRSSNNPTPRPTLRSQRTNTNTSQSTPQNQDHHSLHSHHSHDNSGPYFIYFTSLENYKVVIDAILSAKASIDLSGGDPIEFDLPNIQVLPKPAGPRRILTALHTAIHKPVVDPHFRPLATTPMSPSIYSNTSGSRSSRYSSYSFSRSSHGLTDEFEKTPLEQNNYLSPPPLHKQLTTDSRFSNLSTHSRGSQNATSPIDTSAINYFSNKAAELGEGNKGMIVQSHDGRAAGVFFDPTRSPGEESDMNENDETNESKGSRNMQSGPLSVRSRRSRRSSHSNAPLTRHSSMRKSALYKPNIGIREMIERAKSGGAVEDDGNEGSKPNLESRASTTVLEQVCEANGRPVPLNHSRSDPPPNIFADAAPTITSLPKFTLDESNDIPSSDPANGSGQILASASKPENKEGSGSGSFGGSSHTDRSSHTTSANSVTTSASANSTSTTTSTIKEKGHSLGSIGSTSTIGLSGLDIPKSDSPEPTDEQDNPFNHTPPVSRAAGERPTLNTRQRSKSVLKSIKDAAQAARRDVQNKFNDSRASHAPVNPQGNGWMSGSSVKPPINVLIVEDNPINQTILKKFMTRRNVKYDIALNGQEAVEKWQTGNFHLFLMDLALPILSGVEAARQIRAFEKDRNVGVFPSTPPSELSSEVQTTRNNTDDGLKKDTYTPSIANSIHTNFKFRSPVIIVALTASSATSDRVAALEAGCNDFLTKPVNFQWLERKIIEWGCMQALIDVDGWRLFRMKRFSAIAEEKQTENSTA
ncbi:Response regulator mcs4 [Wallemia ichthyophaga EXF-994]|uniref:Response regulator mcs4 n=1 Tax=Wallemia ichthyophaga (strain EXF-994 / CBS 113033) TaxID=1299270 RepID=R9A9A8_WALI9|nr:Response regulator mcs4 [Wallemia ichthyophaga EXF-994]EOQ98783.1 Response regulator mcs4 [Wallemia ichthyophaga EXF-994]